MKKNNVIELLKERQSIDFMKNDNNTLLDIEENEKNFVSLNQQLIIESDNLDNYGEKLINNL